MADERAPSTNESTDTMMKSLIQHLPAFMQTQNSQVLPQAQTMLEAAQRVSPAYNQLQTDLYRQSAPQLAEIGVGLDRTSRVGAANTDLDIMRGSGGALVKESQALDRQLNPEFYKTRETQSKKFDELLNSFNLNDANPEAERLINQESQRSGNINNGNATNTVANALSFGSALDQRRQGLSNALNTATAFLQPSQGQFNPVATALNRPSTNTGTNQFQGINKNAGEQAYQSGGQLMNQIGQFRLQQNDINANRGDALDKIHEGIGSINV